MTKQAPDPREIFAFFTEVGIISQLSTALLAKSLPEGVHPSHFSILNHLARTGDGKSPVRIAAAMQVTKNTMTHSLKVLEDRNFIATRPDPEDGRGKLVDLTDKGRSFRDAAITKLSIMFGDIFDGTQTDLMRKVRPELEALRKHLDDNRR